jgi:hypothetical protein
MSGQAGVVICIVVTDHTAQHLVACTEQRGCQRGTPIWGMGSCNTPERRQLCRCKGSCIVLLVALHCVLLFRLEFCLFEGLFEG